MLTLSEQIAIREAKRQNPAYRQHSLKCLGQICLARVDLDMSAAVFDIVEPLLKSTADGEPMEVDGGLTAPGADDAYVCTIYRHQDRMTNMLQKTSHIGWGCLKSPRFGQSVGNEGR